MPQEIHEDELSWKRGTQGRQQATSIDPATLGEPGERTHLPPAITIYFILFDNLYALARTKRYFIFVLWGEVVSSIDVFYHGKFSVIWRDARLRV
jgi:hypothetical protein